MKRIYKEYRPPFWTGCNRFLLVWFGAVFIGFSISKGRTATGSVRFFSVRSGPVSVYFQFIEPNLQTLRWIHHCLVPFLIRFVKLYTYYESNLASRTSRTPARHNNPTTTAQAHVSTSQDSSWADNLLGFWSSGHNQTQCNSLKSEVEAYLLDPWIVAAGSSVKFWQVSDSDLINLKFHTVTDFMFRRTSCNIQQHLLLQWTYCPFRPLQSHASECSLQPRKPWHYEGAGLDLISWKPCRCWSFHSETVDS